VVRKHLASYKHPPCVVFTELLTGTRSWRRDMRLAQSLIRIPACRRMVTAAVWE